MSIVEVFQQATADDLEAVRARLKELEGEVQGLQTLERALAERFEGKGGGKLPARSPKAAAGLAERRKQVATYLRSKGPQSRVKLGEALGIGKAGPGCLSQILDHEWFHTNPDGVVTLTTRGATGLDVGD